MLYLMNHSCSAMRITYFVTIISRTAVCKGKELPALKALVNKNSIHDISEKVELAIPGDKALARNVKMYLCQRYTGKKLKEIGLHFGIGESGVSQACRRVAQMMEKDKTLKNKIVRLEKQLNLSKMKT